MDDDRFRSFFGFPGSFRHHGGFGGFQSDDGDEVDEGDDIFDRFRFGKFGRSSPFNDMNDIFKGAEMMMRHMDGMFREFHELGDSGESFPKLAGITGRVDTDDPHRQFRRTARDEMLKVPDSYPAIKSGEESDGIISEPNSTTAVGFESPKMNWSEGHSSMTTFVGLGNGRVEQRRTMKNSDGSTWTSITKRLGDREINVTTKVFPTGETEVEEDLINLDENEKPDFEAEWSGKLDYLPDARHKRITDRRDDPGTHDVTPILDPKGPSIFQRLFGLWK